MAKQSLANKLKAENDQLRDAARQLHAGLLEYAKEENWEEVTLVREEPRSMWKGEGKGPEKARYYLGMDNKEDKN